MKDVQNLAERKNIKKDQRLLCRIRRNKRMKIQQMKELQRKLKIKETIIDGKSINKKMKNTYFQNRIGKWIEDYYGEGEKSLLEIRNMEKLERCNKYHKILINRIFLNII